MVVTAAGMAAFGLNLVVILKVVGLFAAPTLDAGLAEMSGRTTLVTVTRLVASTILPRRWKARSKEWYPVHNVAGHVPTSGEDTLPFPDRAATLRLGATS